MNTKDIPQVELKLPGEKVTMCVEQGRKVPFGKFPEAEFTGTIGTGEMVTVLMPLTAALKQLGNLKLETMNPDGQFMSTVGKYLTIKRSENKQQPDKPYWDIYLAREGEFDQGAKPQPVAKDPSEEFTDEMRAEAAVKRKAFEERKAAERRELDDRKAAEPKRVQSPPAAAAPARPEEQSADEEKAQRAKKKRARMIELRDIFRGLWKSEAIFQLQTAAEIAKEHPELARLEVNGSSVNAQVASLFIEFSRGNLV